MPLILVILILGTSCERDEGSVKVELSSNKINYSLDWSNASNTKGESGRKFLSLIGEDSLFLYVYEEDNVADTLNVQTKDAPYTNETIPSFVSYAYLNDMTSFILGEQVSVTSGVGKSDRFWPESDQLNFFAYATSATGVKNENMAISPSPVFTVGNAGGVYSYSGEFSYSLPNPAAEKNDAENQPDLIFAISPQLVKNSYGGNVPLEFHHALSAIYFKVGNIPSGVKINTISLKGIKYSGDCSLLYSPTGEKPKNVAFEWSNLSADTKDFSQTIANSSDFAKDDIIKTNSNQVFMVIPQNLSSSEATLEISITIGENGYTLVKKLKELTIDNWSADKKYTYIISMPQEVDVEVDDMVEGNVKKALEIENTGMADSYIRVALVGYWILERGDGTEDIVSKWNKDTDGEFTNLCPTGWIKGNDGYYYFTKVLEPHEIADPPLFESYKLTAASPVVGAKLKLSVLVQSVISNKVGSIDAVNGWTFL